MDEFDDMRRREVYYDERLVMILDLIETTISGVRSHEGAQRPFVIRGRVPLEYIRRDKGLKDEPSA